MTGIAISRPAKKPTFSQSMKNSDASVVMSLPPSGSICCIGSMMNGKMYLSRKMNAITTPIAMAIIEEMSRFRSSSRCSRNDIRPPSSSISSGSVSSMSESSSSRADSGSGRSRVGTGAIQALRVTGLAWNRVLRAVVVFEIRRRGLRSRRFSRLGRALAALFLDADLFVERIAELVGRALELTEALAQRPAELRQLSGPEDDQRERQDNEELGHPDGTKHKKPLIDRWLAESL